MPTLYEKSLKCAINDIAASRDRTEANERFIKWSVFHKNVEFKKAIKEKQAKFKAKTLMKIK